MTNLGFLLWELWDALVRWKLYMIAAHFLEPKYKILKGKIIPHIFSSRVKN